MWREVHITVLTWEGSVYTASEACYLTGKNISISCFPKASNNYVLTMNLLLAIFSLQKEKVISESTR